MVLVGFVHPVSLLFFFHTWVDDGVLFIEGDSGVPSFPFGPLDLQVSFFDGQQGDALVVSRVELRQVLIKKEKKKKMNLTVQLI